MDDWLMQEPWAGFFEDNEVGEDSVLGLSIKLFSKLIKYGKKKKRAEEEELASVYNVSVYRVLPYPPGTKDVKDSYVQRS